MASVFFTSDTHYGHKNICRGTSSWEFTNYKRGDGGEKPIGVRDFDTLQQMNDMLVSNINTVVGKDDILWHLGDWSFGGAPNIKEFRDKIKCNNIHLVFGNHDQHIEDKRKDYYKLFQSVQYYKELSFNKNKFILSHYAMRVWNKSHHGAIHLYGHSHGTLPGFGKSMDVGVDTNSLYPYDLDQIFQIMEFRNKEIVDHHNEKTN